MLPSSHRLEGLGLAGSSRNIADDALSDHEGDDDAPCVESASLTWIDARLAQQVMQDGEPGTSAGLRVKQLVVGCVEAAGVFLDCTFPTFSEVGTIATENAAEPRWSIRADVSVGIVGASTGGAGGAESVAFERLLVVASRPPAPGSVKERIATARGKKSINPGDEWRWVEPLMRSIVAEQIVVLDTVKLSAVPLVSAAEGKPQAPFLFQIGTSAFVTEGKRMLSAGISSKESVSLVSLPELPSPILLEGPSAAILTFCEARGANAVALVSLVERVVDSSTLVAFETPFNVGNAGSDSEGERKARKLRYREAVKGFSKKLDGLYL